MPVTSTLIHIEPSLIAQFKQRYSEMSDDELVYLLAAKFDLLNEEAQHALRSVVERRNIKALRAEVAATSVDLEAQARHEEEQRRKQEAQIAAERFLILSLAGIAVVAGVGLVVFGNGSTGWPLVLFAALGAALYEIRRLLGKLLVAMFRN